MPPPHVSPGAYSGGYAPMLSQDAARVPSRAAQLEDENRRLRADVERPKGATGRLDHRRHIRKHLPKTLLQISRSSPKS